MADTPTIQPGKTAKVKKQNITSIRDARGKKVTQLDPVEMRLLRRHDTISPDVLKSMADEIGIGWSKRIRVVFIFSTVCLILFALEITIASIADAIKGARTIPIPIFFMLPCVCIGPVSIWFGTRAARFKRIHRVMLAHLRCPHCGYDLTGLPVDDSDGTTVCPECGCAWMLNMAPAPNQSPPDVGGD